MGRLRTKDAQCQYKEYDKLLMEESISGLNDDGTIGEIPKEVGTIEIIKDTTSESRLLWAYRVEAQKNKKSALNDIKDAKKC